MSDELTVSPVSVPLLCSGEEVGKTGSKVKPEKQEEGVLKFSISLSQVYFAHYDNW